jgi:hypothetical protein
MVFSLVYIHRAVLLFGVFGDCLSSIHGIHQSEIIDSLSGLMAAGHWLGNKQLPGLWVSAVRHIRTLDCLIDF